MAVQGTFENKVLRINIAVNGSAPGNADFEAALESDSLADYANTLGAVFADMSIAEYVAALLDNLGLVADVITEDGYDALAAGLEDYVAAYDPDGVNRGFMAYQLAEILATLDPDDEGLDIYADAQANFNGSVDWAFDYSNDADNETSYAMDVSALDEQLAADAQAAAEAANVEMFADLTALQAADEAAAEALAEGIDAASAAFEDAEFAEAAEATAAYEGAAAEAWTAADNEIDGEYSAENTDRLNAALLANQQEANAEDAVAAAEALATAIADVESVEGLMDLIEVANAAADAAEAAAEAATAAAEAATAAAEALTDAATAFGAVSAAANDIVIDAAEFGIVIDAEANGADAGDDVVATYDAVEGWTIDAEWAEDGYAVDLVAAANASWDATAAAEDAALDATAAAEDATAAAEAVDAADAQGTAFWTAHTEAADAVTAAAEAIADLEAAIEDLADATGAAAAFAELVAAAEDAAAELADFAAENNIDTVSDGEALAATEGDDVYFLDLDAGDTAEIADFGAEGSDIIWVGDGYTIVSIDAEDDITAEALGDPSVLEIFVQDNAETGDITLYFETETFGGSSTTNANDTFMVTLVGASGTDLALNINGWIGNT